MEEHGYGTRIHYRIGGRPRQNVSGVAHHVAKQEQLLAICERLSGITLPE
jgi:hypothetical protein